MKARILLSLLLMSALTGCISSNKQFAYVTGPGTNEVFQFQMRANGTLTALSPPTFPVGSSPVAVLIHPSRLFAYIANFAGNNVTLLSLNKGNGQLTVPTNTNPIPPPTPPNIFSTGNGPIAMAASPNGSFLFVLNQGSQSISAFTVDPANGNLGNVAGSPFGLATCSGSSLAITPKGDALFVTCPGLGTVESMTIDSHGVLSPPQIVSSGGAPSFATVEPLGRFLYVADSTNNVVLLFTLGANGSATLAPAGGSPGFQPSGLATDPQGALLFVANKASNNVSVFAIDPKTGALGAVAGSPFPTGGTGPSALAASQNFLYVADQTSNDVALFSIGKNGALTVLPGSAGVPGSPINIATSPLSIVLVNE